MQLAAMPRPVTAPVPQLAIARGELGRLVDLTGAGLEVAPVAASLAATCSALEGARPTLVERGASPWMLGEVDRVRAAAQVLGASLVDLQQRDRMRVFDAAFATDDPSWDAWFVESRGVIERAEAATAAAG